MRLPDGTTLMHAGAPYDAARAHEYYLRTRELKGRKKGSGGYSVKLSSGRTVKLSSKQLAEQKVYAAKRVNDIKLKLAELGNKLKEAMREAQKKKAASDRKADRPKTAAEKSEAARESKKYRDKNQTKLASKARASAKTKSKSKDDPVADLEEKIGQIKQRLKTAINIQRALAGATKN